MIRAALARLERALAHDGGAFLRNLVLAGEPSEDTWPEDLPALTADARAWLAWRSPGEDMVFLDVPGGGLCELLGFEKAARLTAELQAELPGSVMLLDDIVCDAAGEVSRLGWEGDCRIAVPLEVDVAGLVDRIAARIAERRHSRWRRLRITVGSAAWSEVETLDELERAPAGTAIAWSVQAPRRRRAWCAVKIVDEWATTMTTWSKDFDPEDACFSLRMAFSVGDVTVCDSGALAAQIESARRDKPPFKAVRGGLRVWAQPALEELLVRFSAAARELPIRFAPGIADPSIADEQLRALYAFANGSETAVFFRYRLASIESARTTSRGLLDLADSEFGEAYWHPSFVPFLDKGTGDNLYVDVDGIHGPPGSVIDFDHERPEMRRVLYDSVAQWLECLVEGLELGLYEWADAAVFPRDFLDGEGLYEIRTHDGIYTNGAYPWERRIALRSE